MTRRLATALALAALLAAPAAAQVPVLDIRAGAQAVVPSGDLADAAGTGFGLYGRVGLPTGLMKLMATATWSRFPAKGTGNDTDVIGVAVGPHFQLPMLDAGLEIGYFSEFKEIGFTPSVSMGFGKLDLMASYTLVNSDPKANWIGLGIGLRF